jgi:hypothetical protein
MLSITDPTVQHVKHSSSQKTPEMAPIIQKSDSTLGGAIWILIVILVIAFIVGLAFACYRVTPRHNVKVIKSKSLPTAHKPFKEKSKVDNKPGAYCTQCPCRPAKSQKQSKKRGIAPNSTAEPFPILGTPPSQGTTHARMRQPEYSRQAYRPPMAGLRNMPHGNFVPQHYGQGHYPMYEQPPNSGKKFSQFRFHLLTDKSQ